MSEEFQRGDSDYEANNQWIKSLVIQKIVRKAVMGMDIYEVQFLILVLYTWRHMISLRVPILPDKKFIGSV